VIQGIQRHVAVRDTGVSYGGVDQRGLIRCVSWADAESLDAPVRRGVFPSQQPDERRAVDSTAERHARVHARGRVAIDRFGQHSEHVRGTKTIVGRRASVQKREWAIRPFPIVSTVAGGTGRTPRKNVSLQSSMAPSGR
jgi:hypothetical protein